MWSRLIEAWYRVTASFRRRRLERDLDDEVAFHLAMRQASYAETARPPADARREALRRFGNPTALKEQMRDMWTFPSFESIRQDVRYAVRKPAAPARVHGGRGARAGGRHRAEYHPRHRPGRRVPSAVARRERSVGRRPRLPPRHERPGRRILAGRLSRSGRAHEVARRRRGHEERFRPSRLRRRGQRRRKCSW